MSAMTQAQQDCIERAYDMLGEHFDGFLLAVVSATDGSEGKEFSTVYYKGGRVQALGLAYEALRDIEDAPESEE